MKVKLLVARSGPAGAEDAGSVIEVSTEEGNRMIDAGQAEIVRSAKKAEKAVKQ